MTTGRDSPTRPRYAASAIEAPANAPETLGLRESDRRRVVGGWRTLQGDVVLIRSFDTRLAMTLALLAGSHDAVS